MLRRNKTLVKSGSYSLRIFNRLSLFTASTIQLKMSSSPEIVLVTGANRGIGYSIVQATALRYPQHTYILGCRSPSSGNAATSSLRAVGVKSELDVLELDVTSNTSIQAAAQYIKSKYGRLDVLVNNAGIALRHKDDLDEQRQTFHTIFNTNITSIAVTTTALLPLLPAKVINISSGRASLQRSVNGKLPPTAVVAYSVSKTALNALTVEMQKASERTRFWVANPGHCKTEFNGYRGTKDPLDGAEVVVRLIGAGDGEYGKGGFWEFEEGVMREVPW